MDNNFIIEYANINTILKKYGSDMAPCPFCGGEVIPHHATTVLDDGTKVDYGYRFFCKYGCCMQTKFYDNYEKAREAWNTRKKW